MKGGGGGGGGGGNKKGAHTRYARISFVRIGSQFLPCIGSNPLLAARCMKNNFLFLASFQKVAEKGKLIIVQISGRRSVRGGEEKNRNILERCWNLLTCQLTSGKRCNSAETILLL